MHFFSSFAVYSELKDLIETGSVIFNADGSCVNSILGKKRKTFSENLQMPIFLSDDVLNSEELIYLDNNEKEQVRELFDQGVKHKMKMNFVRQLSKTSGKYI